MIGMPTDLFLPYEGNQALSLLPQPWRMEGRDLGSTGMFSVGSKPGSVSLQCHQDSPVIGSKRKSTFYSNKRLLLVRHQTNQSSPTINFHFALYLVTTATNDPEDLQSRSEEASCIPGSWLL